MDRTIPAPAGCVCPRCNRNVKEGSKKIVRWNGCIYHDFCFCVWRSRIDRERMETSLHYLRQIVKPYVARRQV